MSAILIAIAIMLGILSPSDDFNNLSDEQQNAVEQIVITDIQQM